MSIFRALYYSVILQRGYSNARKQGNSVGEVIAGGVLSVLFGLVIGLIVLVGSIAGIFVLIQYYGIASFIMGVVYLTFYGLAPLIIIGLIYLVITGK